jgi:hypothetical protein
MVSSSAFVAVPLPANLINRFVYEHLAPSRKFRPIWSDRCHALDLAIHHLLLEEEQYDIGQISCTRK